MSASKPINPALLKALRLDDVQQFRSALEEERWRWPEDSPTSNYELLMRAIRMGRKRIANLLLDRGAEVTKKGSRTSPLHQAVKLVGWGGVVEKLLALGAKVGLRNSRGDTVLHAAFRCGAPQPVMDMLLQAYAGERRMDKWNRDGLAFLHIASTRDESKHLREYLELHEADIDSQVSMYSDSYPGYTALHFAVAFGRYDNAKLLLENGADIYFQDVNGSTPLHLALERRDSRMIDLLFSFDKANANIVNVNGVSHFMAACAGSDKSIVEEFLNITLAAGNSPFFTLINTWVKADAPFLLGGYTPLHFAAECGQLENLYGLICSGADPRAVTSLKLTPFMLAFARQQVNVCFFMHQFYRYAVDETLFAAMFVDRNVAVAQVVESKSANTNASESPIDLSNLGNIPVDHHVARPVEPASELSLVASRCRVPNPMANSTPTKLQMTYELMNI